MSSCHIAYNNTCPVFLRINPQFLFGFVYFRQIKDQSIPRGYFQKVNILARVQSVGSLLFHYGFYALLLFTDAFRFPTTFSFSMLFGV